MSAPEPRELIRNAVFTLARDAGAGMATRQVIPGPEYAGWTEREPEPLAGIRAARNLEHAARDAVRRYAKAARQDGRSWSLIGEALGYADDPQPGMTSVAEHAFAAVASDLGAGPTFGWTCPSCGQVVLDRGPELGHPADAEQGHGDGCERLAAMIAAWDAQWEAGGDE